MFNLKDYITSDPSIMLKNELGAMGIVRQLDSYSVTIGDVTLNLENIFDCQFAIEEALKELKQHLFKKWNELSVIAMALRTHPGENKGGSGNVLFLSAVKKSYLLACRFSDLDGVKRNLKDLFTKDIRSFDSDLIHRFSTGWMEVRAIHNLVMTEVYKLTLLKKYQKITKIAQISGPWANLDLPMKERMWEWDDEEDEYFDEREQAKHDQVRYNPEEDKYGFYFVWCDQNRDPYLFEDREEESPYPSRHLLSVP